MALLKLENSTTPYLKLSRKRAPQQGTEVFAIGSPLGVSDALTTGMMPGMIGIVIPLARARSTKSK